MINFYVILLDKDIDRKKYIHNIINTKLPVLKILDAVDGSKIQQDFINFLYNTKVITPRITHQYSKGTIGCYLSHMKMWTTVRNKHMRNTIILEDDFTISDNFTDNINNVLNELPNTYDICYLFYHPFSYKYYKNFNKFEIHDKKYIRKQVPTWGLVGYILSYKGAIRLIELCNKMTGPVDNMVAKQILLGNLEAYHSKELLVDTIGECLYKDKKLIKFKSNATGGGFII